MINSQYNNSKIYMLVSKFTNKIYIGSTTSKLTTRKYGHTQNYRRWLLKTHSYCSSYQIIKLGKYYIFLLENYNCNTKDELRQREQHYINLNKGLCVNIYNAYSTKAIKRQQQQKYRDTHVEQINAKRDKNYHKEYFKKNQENIYAKRKIYNEKNKKQQYKYQKKYREDRQELIKQKKKDYASKTFICVCGMTLKNGTNKARHYKTNAHLINI